jgi:uncharacterized cysteine cluster protein YcgN (CxxCxxCC family)
MADFSPDAAGWDKLCKKCGSCCFEKIEDQRGNIFYMQSACRFLDIDSRRCKIFARRFEINPSCVQLTPELVESLRWLPRGCGYHRKNVEPVTVSRKRKK